MGDLVDQLPTLAGVGIGALASYLVSFANDRSRWRRETRSRQDEKRLSVYAEYGRATKAEFQWTMRVAHCRGLPSFGPTQDEQTVELELSRAGHERATRWEEVLLVGSAGAIAAARGWHESIWRMQDVARAAAPDAAAWHAALVESDRARSAFYETIRKDLGISPAKIPGVVRPPDWAKSPDAVVEATAPPGAGPAPDTRPRPGAVASDGRPPATDTAPNVRH